MKKEELFNIIDEADEQKVAVVGTATTAKKKTGPIWLTWGAIAACLCIAIAGYTILMNQKPQTADVGEGGAEGNYSIAVYPASESIKNVASAEVVSLTENEALSNELAEYLPKQLPDGFHYGRGSIYNTVMKDGTQYNMLRIEYISGTIPEQQFTEDGGAIAPNPYTIGDLFTVRVMNYAPKTKLNVYSSVEEAIVSLFEENGSVCIRLGDCYISVFAETADPEAVLEAIKNIE